jgi:hypothetical protein
MNLRPDEAELVRRLISGESTPGLPPPDPSAEIALLLRLNEEAPPLGAHVFRVVCMLGGDANKLINASLRERKKLRVQLGKTRLGNGEGPAVPEIVYAPTLNEYNALDPWKKGELCDAVDAEINTLRGTWPMWSCGSIDRAVERPGKKVRCVDCKGDGNVVRKRKAGPVRVQCTTCEGSGKAPAPPQMVREGGRRRAVVITRESSVRPDEIAADPIGGKIPLDRLVQAGVLRGDSPQWLVRYCDWKAVSPGEGRVVVDVYEILSC